MKQQFRDYPSDATTVEAVAPLAQEVDQKGECIIRRAARVAQGAPGEGGTRRLAFLVFDSADDAPLVGARSAKRRARRMLFQSGPAALDIELRADQRGGHLNSLFGQIRGDGCNGLRIRLDGPGAPVEADIDEHGWFELAPVRSGTYSATILLDSACLEVPSLVI